jgi:hypothetical protein
VDARRLGIPLGGDGARSLRVVAHFRALRPSLLAKIRQSREPRRVESSRLFERMGDLRTPSLGLKNG